MERSPKIVKAAYCVAFLMAAWGIVSLLRRPIIALPFVLIPLIAGVGIVRRRVWSAYGFAVYLFACGLLLTWLQFRDGRSGRELLEIIGMLVGIFSLPVLFLFAGKSLSKAGAARGSAVPWIAVSALFVLPFFFVSPFVNPTGSMEDTLLIGDYILVQRWPISNPTRGDIVVFHPPSDKRQIFVKRVIGIPGDRIHMTKKIVYRNGSALKESYAVHKSDYESSYRDNFPDEPNISLQDGGQEMLAKHVVNEEVIVPSGKYFVLGDNRDSSLDSRYFGFVDSNDLIGKPLLVYYSEDRSTLEIEEQPKGRKIRWNRFFKLL